MWRESKSYYFRMAVVYCTNYADQKMTFNYKIIQKPKRNVYGDDDDDKMKTRIQQYPFWNL